jgi:hypothetical protein
MKKACPGPLNLNPAPFTSIRAWILILGLAVSAFPQSAAPYIADIYADAVDDLSKDDPTVTLPRRLCNFKIFNPDTAPFYLWLSFGRHGVLRHEKRGEGYPDLRLTDLELRYKNDLSVPMVKIVPKRGERAARALGLGKGGFRNARDVKKGSRRGADALDGDGGGHVGAAEVAFWQEDAQGYYEMELWGSIYEPDLEKGVGAGRYSESVEFEIEAMPFTLKKQRRGR